MALYLNSTKIGSTAYNVHNSVSTKLNKMKMGNTDVWQGLPPYYNELKNGTVLTQSQWLEFLNGDGIATVIAKGDQASFRGKQVQVENSQTSSYKNWIIADFNHDSTSGTCDLIQTNTIYNSVFGTTKNYANASVRTWLNGTYYNGFISDIKNKMITMEVSSNNTLLNDNVKLLSGTELNLSNTYLLEEGTSYPIFTDKTSRRRTGQNNYWWTRSGHYGGGAGYASEVWFITAEGNINTNPYSTNYGLVPCIRFS